MSGHLDRSPETPPWAVLARGVLLCDMVLTSGSILVPKHGLFQPLERPHGRAAISNERFLPGRPRVSPAQHSSTAPTATTSRWPWWDGAPIYN